MTWVGRGWEKVPEFPTSGLFRRRNARDVSAHHEQAPDILPCTWGRRLLVVMAVCLIGTAGSLRAQCGPVDFRLERVSEMKGGPCMKTYVVTIGTLRKRKLKLKAVTY